MKRVDWFFNHICSERVWSREGWAKVAQQTKVSTMLHWQLFFFYDWLSHNHRKQITASPRAMAYSKPPSWCLAELLNSYKWTSFFFALPLSVSCGHSHLFQPVWTSPNGPERAKLSCHSFLDETSSNTFAGGWKFPHFAQTLSEPDTKSNTKYWETWWCCTTTFGTITREFQQANFSLTDMGRCDHILLRYESVWSSYWFWHCCYRMSCTVCLVH